MKSDQPGFFLRRSRPGSAQLDLRRLQPGLRALRRPAARGQRQRAAARRETLGQNGSFVVISPGNMMISWNLIHKHGELMRFH